MPLQRRATLPARLRMLLVTLPPPRVMPLLPPATPPLLPPPSRLRPRASSRPSRSSNLHRPSPSVFVPISTDDGPTEDTGRDSPPGILAAEPPSEVCRDSQYPRRAELSAGPHLDPGAVPGISRRPFAHEHEHRDVPGERRTRRARAGAHGALVRRRDLASAHHPQERQARRLRAGESPAAPSARAGRLPHGRFLHQPALAALGDRA